jgi:proteasome assembly chaperone (PAC2) family protein
MDGGSITGMNGIMIGIAKLRGMKGVCLLGETSGYVVDAKSSKSLLEILLSIIGIKINMTNLEKRAKDTEALIQTIEKQIAGRTSEGNQGSSQNKPSSTGYIS